MANKITSSVPASGEREIISRVKEVLAKFMGTRNDFVEVPMEVGGVEFIGVVPRELIPNYIQAGLIKSNKEE